MNEEDNNVPNHTKGALERYWLYGYAPGSFLGYVLCGDIYNAVTRADSSNLDALGHILVYIVRNAPRGSYGSVDLYQDWVNKGEMFQWHQKNRVIEYLSTE